MTIAAVLESTSAAWLALELGAFGCASCLSWLGLRKLRQMCGRYHQRFCSQMGERLSRSFIFVEPDRLFLLNLLLMALALTATWSATASLGFGLTAAALTGLLPVLLMHRLESRRRRALARQLPEMLMLLASTLRSGLSLSLALDHVGRQTAAPLGQELEVLSRERRLGVSLDLALANLLARAPSVGMHLFCGVIRVSHANGGGLADALLGLAQAGRRQLLLDAKMAALTAQGRLQANVMTVIPLVVAAALLLIEPQAMSQLFVTPFGWAISGLTACLLALGAWWVRRIAQRSVNVT